MAITLPIPRLHLFEIDDQTWFPQFLREKVQACLELLWRLRFPILQPASPATLAASTLQQVLGSTLPSYTFVDFCAGAGGPTPSIERSVNEFLKQSSSKSSNSASNGLSEGSWLSKKPKKQDPPPSGVDFILTDLFPHTPAWSQAAKRSEHIHYVAESIDAANAPPDLLAKAGFPTYGTTGTPSGRKASSRKIFRLYNLAFHHFPDPLAEAILLNTLSTADGFAIFELQGRDCGESDYGAVFGAITVGGELLFKDKAGGGGEGVGEEGGRGEGERGAWSGRGAFGGWRFEAGFEMHTWPGGRMQYFVGIKN